MAKEEPWQYFLKIFYRLKQLEPCSTSYNFGTLIISLWDKIDGCKIIYLGKSCFEQCFNFLSEFPLRQLLLNFHKNLLAYPSVYLTIKVTRKKFTAIISLLSLTYQYSFKNSIFERSSKEHSLFHLSKYSKI